MFNFFKKETRAEIDSNVINIEALFSTPIDKRQAMSIPSVCAAVNFISGTIAMMPIKLYEQKNGRKKEITNDYRLNLINREPETLLDANQFKKAIVTDYLLAGNGYAYINKIGNKIKSLHYVDEINVSINRSPDPIFKAAEFYIYTSSYKSEEIYRITKNSKDGVTGTGIIEENAELFKTMYQAIMYEQTQNSSGIKKGFLTSTEKITEEGMDKLREVWNRIFSSEKKTRMAVLNRGLEFHPAGITASENQLSENKEFNTSSVYAVFGLSDDLFGQGSTTIDVYNKSVKMGVFPVLTAIESALNKYLLLEKEKDRLFFSFDTSKILRAEILERYKAYEIAKKNGFMQIDEIRQVENLEPLDIEFLTLGLNDVLYYPKTNQIYTPNTAQGEDLNNIKKEIPAKGGDKNENRNKVE